MVEGGQKVKKYFLNRYSAFNRHWGESLGKIIN